MVEFGPKTRSLVEASAAGSFKDTTLVSFSALDNSTDAIGLPSEASDKPESIFGNKMELALK